MLFSWRRPLAQRDSATRTPHKRSRSTKKDRREPHFDLLEPRDLPSAVTPFHLVRTAGAGATPLATSGPTGYTPAQVRHAYGFDQVSFSGTPGDGRGTTVAIVDAYDDPNIASDLTAFDTRFGIQAPPSFTKVNQSGGTALPAADSGWASEIALDVEWAHADAPGAGILLVEASDSSYTNLFSAVGYAARQPGVVAVSTSWGGGESPSETSWDSNFTTPAGHSGVVFVASSGDSGAPASYPAISPNVLAVGGTSLPNLDAAGDYTGETGWSGSGGGVSAYEAQPAYQKGVVTQSGTYRTNPDVAYDADPNTGFPVYDSYNNGTTTPWSQFGGTSDAAPQWAALVAIADQGRAAAGKAALDGPTALSTLYSLPASDFHDVTGGSSTGSPGESAGPGYDLVTGRGTPLANQVTAGLVGPAATTTATHFRVTVSSPSTAAGTAESVTVTALDANNNTVSTYADAVHFTSSDAQAALPADYTFTSADAGSHTFSVTLKTAGSQTITATDLANSSIQGSATVTVTAAATQSFRVSGFPPPVTAGTAGSFTVTAVDAYGNPESGYAGTVHFTSSDPSAVLPADAALTNGTGTFSATFKKAGSESLTATDKANASMTGTESGITVNPAAATHLAFAQQPTNVAAGSAISPAVTVQLLDAYNNVVTTDSTDQVKLALGTNPAGGALSGTTIVTASHGVATFGNLSIDRTGTGYTLTAASGTLTGATSAAFSVTAQTATVVENFENGLGQYWLMGYNYPTFSTTTAAAHDGTYGLDNGGNGDWIYRDDTAAQVKQGDTISAWVRLANAADGRAYFGFGASSGGTLSLVVAPNTGQLLLQDNTGYGFSSLAAANQTYVANQWYRVEVDWGTSGKIVGRLYGSDGRTLLNTVQATDTAITSGGFAFRAIGHDKYWDTVTVVHGANTFLASQTTGETSRQAAGSPASAGNTWTSHGAGARERLFAEARDQGQILAWTRAGRPAGGALYVTAASPAWHGSTPAAPSAAAVDRLFARVRPRAQDLGGAHARRADDQGRDGWFTL